MRSLLPLFLILAAGCHHCPRIVECNDRCERETVGECEPDCPPMRKVHKPHRPTPKREIVCETEPPCPQEKPCPTPVKRAEETIHVKLPPQKIIIQQQEAPVQQITPQMIPQTQMVAQPQAMMAQPQMMMAMPQSQGFSQSAPMGRARPGFTIDFFRLPIPFPRLIAVPDAAPMMQAVPVAMTQAVPMAMTQSAPQMVGYAQANPQMMGYAQAAPQMMAYSQPPAQAMYAQAQATPTHAVVPVQGHTTVPVNVQAQAVVPVQGHAVVPVNSQTMGIQTQPFSVQQQAVISQSQAQPTVVAQPQMQGISLEQAREFCRLVKELEDRMKQK